MNYISAAAFAALISVSAMAQKSEKVAIVAHRGYWQCEAGGMARNSIASLTAAQDNGFWGSETDVTMTKDGVVLIHHDPTIDGKKIEKNLYADLKYKVLENGESVPTIEEYLQKVKDSKTVLVLEIKKHSTPEIENACVERCINAIKEADLWNPKRIAFISFSENICRTLAARAPEFAVQYLAKDLSPEYLQILGIDEVDWNYRFLNKKPEWLKDAQKRGMTVNVWTVNEKEDIKAMVNKGVNMITTDNPEVVREVLKEMGVKEVKPGKKVM